MSRINHPAKVANSTKPGRAVTKPATNGNTILRRAGRECKDCSGGRNMAKANLRRLSCLVSAQTLYNLYKLAKICGYGDNVGKVIDKLTREKMIQLKGEK